MLTLPAASASEVTT